MKAVVFEYVLAAANAEEDYTMICFMHYLEANYGLFMWQNFPE